MRNRQSNNRFKQEKVKSKFLKIAFAAALAVVSGVTAYQAQDKEILSDLALANVEALAGGESGGGGTVHSLECGQAGLKMCEATCGRCNVTLKAWGNGGSTRLTCSAY